MKLTNLRGTNNVVNISSVVVNRTYPTPAVVGRVEHIVEKIVEYDDSELPMWARRYIDDNGAEVFPYGTIPSFEEYPIQKKFGERE